MSVSERKSAQGNPLPETPAPYKSRFFDEELFGAMLEEGRATGYFKLSPEEKHALFEDSNLHEPGPVIFDDALFRAMLEEGSEEFRRGMRAMSPEEETEFRALFPYLASLSGGGHDGATA